MIKIKMKLFASIFLTMCIICTFSFAAYADKTQKMQLAPSIKEETESELPDETESETERPYSDDDFYELSHVISAEAGNCTWDMMAGVGYVVMNRVKAKAWPNTVYEVIHQPGQYTCVDNGAFYAEPTEMACEVADYVLRNGSQYPEDVVYQANSVLGYGEYTRESCPGYRDMIYSYGKIE